MNQELKNLIVGIRQTMPSWATDANISIVLKVSHQGDVCVNMVGLPPTDETSVKYGDRHGEIIQNWGVKEVETMLDTPDKITERRAVLKEYDNKKNSGRWGTKKNT